MRGKRRAAAVATLAAITGACGSGHARKVTDGAIELTLPAGWSSSIGPGTQAGRPVAWFLAGDFGVAPDAARQEGGPAVPRGRMLISIGDFVTAGPSLGWPRVRRLALRGNSPAPLRVRFAARSLWVQVRFGSEPPTRADIERANAVLATLRSARR